MQLLLKILSEMANSVELDQTAPSALFANVILSATFVFEILGHLPSVYITNQRTNKSFTWNINTATLGNIKLISALTLKYKLVNLIFTCN